MEQGAFISRKALTADLLPYANSHRVTQLATKKPVKSAMRAAGMVYRVRLIPAAPK